MVSSVDLSFRAVLWPGFAASRASRSDLAPSTSHFDLLSCALFSRACLDFGFSSNAHS